MRLSEDSKDNSPTHRGFGGLDWASQKHNVVIVESAGSSKGYTRPSSSHRIATRETHHSREESPLRIVQAVTQMKPPMQKTIA